MYFDLSDELSHIIVPAFKRSFGTLSQQEFVYIVEAKRFKSIYDYPRNSKIIVLGEFSEQSELFKIFNCSRINIADYDLAELQSCDAASSLGEHTESLAFLKYHSHYLTSLIPDKLLRRPLCRFDFANEWNNFGFGRIRLDNNIWSASLGKRVDSEYELATVYFSILSSRPLGTFLALRDYKEHSIFWCSRPVGLVDSVEWVIFETFLSTWRPDLTCVPRLCQSPFGFRCITTMRLDCDEAVSTAEDLFHCYVRENIPLSLALKTNFDFNNKDMNFIKEVRRQGGSILSHSHSHLRNWGGTSSSSAHDFICSRDWFLNHLKCESEYVVSPFHCNSVEVLLGLCAAGARGLISGIIANDPEFLMGRAGQLPFCQKGIVGSSQQCMLHGDCYHQANNSISVYRDAFNLQYAVGGIFGYLDHPFSERYTYGWLNSNERNSAHIELIKFMKHQEGVLFMNEIQLMNYLRFLNSICIEKSNKTFTFYSDMSSEYAPAYEIRGELLKITYKTI